MIPEFVAYPLMLIALCVGVGAGALVVALLWRKDLNERTEFGGRLGRPCWMKNRYRKGKRWLNYRVVAVSHKGGIAVRKWDDLSGHGAVWIDKTQVPTQVRFDEPVTGGEQ